MFSARIGFEYIFFGEMSTGILYSVKNCVIVFMSMKTIPVCNVIISEVQLFFIVYFIVFSFNYRGH